MKKYLITIIMFLVLTACAPNTINVNDQASNSQSEQESSKSTNTDIPPALSITATNTIQPTETEMPIASITPTQVPVDINSNNIGDVKVISELSIHFPDPVYDIDFSADGTELISGGGDYLIFFTDLTTGDTNKSFYLGSGGVYAAEFSPAGNIFSFGCGSGKYGYLNYLSRDDLLQIILNTPTFSGNEENEKGVQNLYLNFTKANIKSLAYPETYNLFGVKINLQNEKDLEFWNEYQQKTFHFETPEENGEPVDVFWIWYASMTNELPQEFAFHAWKRGTAIREISISPSGESFTIGGNGSLNSPVDAVIHPFDESLESISLEALLKKSYGVLNAIAYSADGSMIATGGGADHTIRIWDATDGALLNELIAHSNDIEEIVFSPDSRFMVSGSDDSMVFLWDTNTWEYTNILSPTGARALAFSKDGSLLFTSGRINRLDVWNVNSGEKLTSFDLSFPAMDIEVSPFGDFVAVATSDGKVTILGLMN